MEKENRINITKVMELAKKHKNLLIKAGLVLLVIFMIVSMIDKIKSNIAQNTIKVGYEEITDVPGLSFQIEKIALDASTAVMEISKKVDFATNQTYMYRNGKDTYLLFNMNNFIVVAKKGTTFNFAENSINDSLDRNSLNGIWFTLEGKESSVKREKNRYEVNVNAQVVITNDVYNDFVGKLVVFEEEETEWAFFVGSPNKSTPFYESELDVILASLKRSDNDIMILDSYEIDMNSGFFASAEKLDKEQANENEAFTPEILPNDKEHEEDSSFENREPENSEPSTEPVVPEQPEDPSLEEEKIDVPDIVVPEEVPETAQPSKEEESMPSSTENESKEESTEEKSEETVEDMQDESEVFFDNNQIEIIKEETKAYTSSIYAMLKVGDTGYMDIVDDHKKTGLYSGAYVKVREVLGASKTQEIINDYIASGKAYYEEMTPPDGCHFESIVYDVQYTTEYDLYTNIKLLGIDGEILRFRGIKYSDKTYDILSQNKEDGWVIGNVCFYIVPNGCEEYVIKCGDGTSETYGFGAYYHVEVSR